MKPDIAILTETAYRLRLDCVQAVHDSALKHGHLGGCMSMAEVVAALYWRFLRVDPQSPHLESRDRFLLSKGHNCLMQYAALAERGYFPMETLASYKSLGSVLQGHPDMNKCPGIDFTSGSLGQGLSIGVGMALSLRRRAPGARVYVLLSDGELQEGMTWEAAMAASHYRLDNLCCIVDRNNLQVNGETQNIMNVEPLEERFSSFGWAVARIDGHDMAAVVDVLARAASTKGKPFAAICDTVKGKGVSFMENVIEWHAMTMTDEQYERARAELMQAIARIRAERED